MLEFHMETRIVSKLRLSLLDIKIKS